MRRTRQRFRGKQPGSRLEKRFDTLWKALGGPELTSITLPDTLRWIEPSAFLVCDSLAHIEGGNQVMQIGAAAFRYCRSLSIAFLPESLITLGESAFENCSDLSSFAIPAGLSVLESKIFFNCDSLTAISIPDNITSIGSSAFAHCDRLTLVSIPASVETIGSNAFQSCPNLISISVAPSNLNYMSIGGVLFNGAGTMLLLYPDGLAGGYRVPDGVTTIHAGAFGSCENLMSITLPATLTNIGAYAFSNCQSISQFRFLGAAPTSLRGANLSHPTNGTRALVSGDHADSFGGSGAIWEGLLVTIVPSAVITDTGLSGDNFFIDVAYGTDGLKVTFSRDLETDFTQQLNVSTINDENGLPNRFLIPFSDLPRPTGFFRVEVE